jgi:hemerythrin-like domain-containing protein
MSLLHTPPAVGFDQPFEMLSACHERVQRSLALLGRLAAHLLAAGADAAARDAAGDVLRYFDLAAPHHHEDEERHVLPRLREMGRADVADRLAADHQAMHAAWAALRPGLLALRDDARVPDTAAWAPFAAMYDAHIALEEELAYPTVRAQLDAPALAAMGGEMAGRRRA